MHWQGDSLVTGEQLHASIQSSLKHNMRAVEQHTQATELSSGRSVEIAAQQIENATKSCISGKYTGQLIKKLGMVSYTGKPLQKLTAIMPLVSARRSQAKITRCLS